ncbi:hypothetical protein IP88_13465 [alpha proteobacterium AAP81b]|nr:hypothetical protein IP88_13465 [alpha proteobacterium AAP81b]
MRREDGDSVLRREGGESVLRREGGDRGPSLAERLAQRATATLHASPLHRLRLKGRQPLRLLGVPADPVPGDPQLGERLAAGRLIHAGATVMTRDLDFGGAGLAPAWRDHADSWGWLRDLAAWAPDRAAGAKVAEPLVRRWLARFADYDAVAWSALVTGRRLLFAFAHAPLILSSSDSGYRTALLGGLAGWARHLDRAAFRLPDGLAKAEALAGLHAAGHLIPMGEARVAAALAGLEKLLPTLVLPDGGIASRAPVDALALAELLIFSGNAALAVDARPAPVFADSLARLAPSLMGMALGDGMIGAWGGGAPIAAGALDRLAKGCATGTQLVRAGRWSGYYRLSAGRTVIVADAGPPPLARIAAGHAGTLAFELSDGPDRVIVNCGGDRGLPAPLPGPLAQGLRTTAAHSTLVVADTNSTRIRDDGALGLGVEEVSVSARSSEEGHWLEASHDGYAKRFGMVVTRRLFLSADGSDLRGEDALAPAVRRRLGRATDRAFDIRFHLGVGVTATPTADGAGALLKLPAGRVWAMKARGGPVAIEPSLWIDAAGGLHKTWQLVIAARTEKAAASVQWSFKRAGK